MRKRFSINVLSFIFLFVVLISCKKEEELHHEYWWESRYTINNSLGYQIIVNLYLKNTSGNNPKKVEILPGEEVEILSLGGIGEFNGNLNEELDSLTITNSEAIIIYSSDLKEMEDWQAETDKSQHSETWKFILKI